MLDATSAMERVTGESRAHSAQPLAADATDAASDSLRESGARHLAKALRRNRKAQHRFDGRIADIRCSDEL